MEQSKQMGIIAKPRGILKILWEGLKLPYNNFALLYPILLLSFLYSSLLFLLAYLCLNPLILDLNTKSTLIGNTNPESPQYSLLLTAVLKDLKELGLIEVAALVISFLIRSLVAAAAVHVLSTAYSSKTPSKLKEVFARFNWPLIKGVLVSLGCSLVVLLTAVVFFFFFFFFTYTYSSSSSSGSYDVGLMVIFTLGGIVVAVLEVWLYIYLLMVVNTGVVVSVVEEGSCYGLEAITKASKLFRGGRIQAIRIALLQLAVGGDFFTGYNLVMAPAAAAAAAAPVNMARLALGFGQVALGVVVNVVIWSAQTVYDYECMQRWPWGGDCDGGWLRV